MTRLAAQATCLLCDKLITKENDSDEHIIPNSIGGRRKVRNFVCSDCNSQAGKTWDLELAQQLNILCVLFEIKRERGLPQSEIVQTSAGERYLLKSNGRMTLAKPSYSTVETDKGFEIKIAARTLSEANKMLRGARRKYNSAIVTTEIQKPVSAGPYIRDPINLNLTFGGELAGRSIVKTAVAAAHKAGIEARQCEVALTYLRERDVPACFGFYYEKELIADRLPGTPTHCVAVNGNPNTGLLLAYIEYFSVHRVVICLSKRYRGKPLDFSHGINPLNGKLVPTSVAFPFVLEDLQSIYDYLRIPDGAIQRAFERVLSPLMARKFEEEKSRVFSDAVDHAIAACGMQNGDTFTAQRMFELSGLISRYMMPFIMNNLVPTPNHHEVQEVIEQESED